MVIYLGIPNKVYLILGPSLDAIDDLGSLMTLRSESESPGPVMRDLFVLEGDLTSFGGKAGELVARFKAPGGRTNFFVTPSF